MVEWTQLAPAIAAFVLGPLMWLWARRIQANARRARDRERAERERLIAP
jgi:hypothetical protein